MNCETKSILDFFKYYYSTSADNHLKILSISPKKYIFNSVILYHRHFIQSDAFLWAYTTEIYIETVF